jgi:hypothetical protein
MEDNEPIIGQLFDVIPYKSEEDISNLIDNMNLPQSIHMITNALEMSIRQNIYSLHEQEIILKSMRILNKSVFSKQNDGTNQI